MAEDALSQYQTTVKEQRQIVIKGGYHELLSFFKLGSGRMMGELRR